MAVFANIGRIEVSVVLAGRIDTVVAGKTVARYVGMIENGGDPHGAVVAVVTVIAAYDVPWRFALRGCAVVTGSATAGHGQVLHVIDRAPGGRRVATITGLGRRDMPGRFH